MRDTNKAPNANVFWSSTCKLAGYCIWSLIGLVIGLLLAQLMFYFSISVENSSQDKKLSHHCSTTPLVLPRPDGRPCLSRETLAVIRAGQSYRTKCTKCTTTMDTSLESVGLKRLCLERFGALGSVYIIRHIQYQ